MKNVLALCVLMSSLSAFAASLDVECQNEIHRASVFKNSISYIEGQKAEFKANHSSVEMNIGPAARTLSIMNNDMTDLQTELEDALVNVKNTCGFEVDL